MRKIGYKILILLDCFEINREFFDFNINKNGRVRKTSIKNE
jgi:hypothetical protein